MNVEELLARLRELQRQRKWIIDEGGEPAEIDAMIAELCAPRFPVDARVTDGARTGTVVHNLHDALLSVRWDGWECLHAVAAADVTPVDAQVAELLDESTAHYLARRYDLALVALDHAQDVAGAADRDRSPIGMLWGYMRKLISDDWESARAAHEGAVVAGVA